MQAVQHLHARPPRPEEKPIKKIQPVPIAPVVRPIAEPHAKPYTHILRGGAVGGAGRARLHGEAVEEVEVVVEAQIGVGRGHGLCLGEGGVVYVCVELVGGGEGLGRGLGDGRGEGGGCGREGLLLLLLLLALGRRDGLGGLVEAEALGAQLRGDFQIGRELHGGCVGLDRCGRGPHGVDLVGHAAEGALVRFVFGEEVLQVHVESWHRLAGPLVWLMAEVARVSRVTLRVYI